MNILIVDDDPDLVALARRWLERDGHAVDHVGTGPAALEMLALDPLPDLVLLDVMLPRIDGFAVLKKIRADARLARLPVMIVSGVADRHQDVARAKALGVDDYIVKPLMEFHFLGRVARFAKAK
ncbi:MAG TPA: response regulator [Burkholderiales bacterium]|nr:response regulator [Burkholderiales bacterium]